MKEEEIGRMLKGFESLEVPVDVTRVSEKPLHVIRSYLATFSDDELDTICEILGIGGGEHLGT